MTQRAQWVYRWLHTRPVSNIFWSLISKLIDLKLLWAILTGDLVTLFISARYCRIPVLFASLPVAITLHFLPIIHRWFRQQKVFRNKANKCEAKTVRIEVSREKRLFNDISIAVSTWYLHWRKVTVQIVAWIWFASRFLLEQYAVRSNAPLGRASARGVNRKQRIEEKHITAIGLQTDIREFYRS